MRPSLTPEQRADEARRQSLELSLARAQADLRRATAPAHRHMLEQAIASLRGELEKLSA